MELENLYDSLTDEQKKKAMACESSEELVSLAKAEGIELTDAQLESVAGGSWSSCSDYKVTGKHSS